MGDSLIKIIVDTLCEEGIAAQRAMSAGKMLRLDAPAAAVQIHRLDQQAETATALVSVLTPVEIGACACEESALTICRILQNAGGSCRQEKTEYRSELDLFCTEVYAVYKGQETERGWQAWVAEPEPEFSVFVGNATTSAAVSFIAHRAVDDTVTVLGDALWHFRLEERFDLDEAEPVWPSEPFSITVQREGRTEVYSGCVVTSQRRSLDKTGQTQIREGTAHSCTTK